MSALAWRAELVPSSGQWLALQGPVLKATVAPLREFNLGLLVGAADWFDGTPPEGFHWWSKGYRPVVGLSGWLELFKRDRFLTFFGGHLALHWGEGAHYRRDWLSGQLRIVEWDEVKQLTGLGSGCGGMGVEARPFRFYAGIAGRKWARRYQQRRQVRTPSGWRKEPAREREQWWGAQYGPFLAVEWRLPGRFFLSLEGARWGPHAYSLSLGLGQIGPP